MEIAKTVGAVRTHTHTGDLINDKKQSMIDALLKIYKR